MNITIKSGTTISLQQVKDSGLSDAAVSWVFTELSCCVDEPGQHTLELPPELEGQSAVIEAVVRVLLSPGN